MKTYQLGDKKLNDYTDYCNEYLDLFGLREWEVICMSQKMDDLAACSADRDGRLALLLLANEWKAIKPDESGLRDAALHEVLELLLWDLCAILKDPRTSDEEINATRHSVIRRLEYVLKKGDMI